MKKVTMRDVAERAGCSKATVSYCITNRRSISEETKARVRKAMNELNYHPSRERKARGGGHKVIAILVNDFYYMTPGGLLDLIQEKLYSKGYLPAVFCMPPDANARQQILRSVSKNISIAGIINMASQVEGVDLYKWNNGLPTIINCRDSDLSPSRLDYGQITRICANAFLEAKRSKIIFCIEDRCINRPVIQWYLSTFAKIPELSCQTVLLPKAKLSVEAEENFFKEIRELFADGYNGVLAQSVFFASLIYRLAADEKWNIPKDLSVISLEDSLLGGYLTPPLARIKLPVEHMANVLLQALEERLDANPKPFSYDQLAPVLIPGGSVK